MVWTRVIHSQREQPHQEMPKIPCLPDAVFRVSGWAADQADVLLVQVSARPHVSER